jgi:two-component system sensor histidine kinase KdpD
MAAMLSPSASVDSEPYLLAVVSPHPDLAQFLQDAQWLAREQGLGLAVALESRGRLRRWLHGEDREVARFVGRWEVASITWRSPGEVAALLSREATRRPHGVVFGPLRRLPWQAGLLRRDAGRIARAAAAAGIPLLHDLDDDLPSGDSGTIFGLHWRLDHGRPWHQGYLYTAIAAAFAGAFVAWLAPLLPQTSLAIVFLTAVVYSASTYGFGAAAVAAATSVILNALIFAPKDGALTLSWAAAELLLFLLFLVIGAITSSLAGGLRRAVAGAQRQTREARALFQLTREIAIAADAADTFSAIVRQCDEVFSCRSVLMAPFQSGDGGASPTARSRAAALQVAYPPDAHLTQDELEAARWSFTQNAPAGLSTPERPDLDALVVPLATTDGMVAVLVLQDIPPRVTKAAGFRRVVGSMCRLAAIAIERALRKQEVEDARVLSQTEGLRSALLSSISHDFGTPLASIIGSASSLLSYGGTYAPEVHRELLTTILEEAERLGRFVKNLMQMTRLESGALVPRLAWADVGDLIATALDAAQRRMQKHTIAVDAAERLPLLHIDFVLMETVMVNVLENAAKYSPPETTIQIVARRAGDEVMIDVTDQGRGISVEDLGAVFDKFYRAKQRDRIVPGTGLGLAICKGIVEAHGGSIEALSPGLGRGTTIRIRLPVKTPDSAETAET